MIAERVLGLYYPQTRTYVGRQGVARTPRQISMKTSAVLASVEGLREVARTRRCRTIEAVRSALPVEYDNTLDAVEETFVRCPIPLMQVVGAGVIPFLCEVDWPEGTSAKALRRVSRDRIRLLDGVPDRLVVLGPMLRPLIELHWTRDVARWTRLPMEDEALHPHLFGSEGTGFPRDFGADLSDMQHGNCFYCGYRLGSHLEVDHFLAWSRWPNDAVENLVVADRCNGAKSDHLAARERLVRRRLRLELLDVDLATVADQHRWLISPDRSRALAQTTYAHLVLPRRSWLNVGHATSLAS